MKTDGQACFCGTSLGTPGRLPQVLRRAEAWAASLLYPDFSGSPLLQLEPRLVELFPRFHHFRAETPARLPAAADCGQQA